MQRQLTCEWLYGITIIYVICLEDCCDIFYLRIWTLVRFAARSICRKIRYHMMLHNAQVAKTIGPKVSDRCLIEVDQRVLGPFSISSPILSQVTWQVTWPGIGSHVHHNDVIMTTMSSQITSLTVVCSTVYLDADQRKHQSSASLAFVWGIHRDRWIPRTKGQLRGKCFHLMTSSWTCVVFCLCFLKWLHRSHGPKSLGLFWNAPYCFPSDALLTSPWISVNDIVTSHVNTIVTSLNAAP